MVDLVDVEGEGGEGDWSTAMIVVEFLALKKKKKYKVGHRYSSLTMLQGHYWDSSKSSSQSPCLVKDQRLKCQKVCTLPGLFDRIFQIIHLKF